MTSPTFRPQSSRLKSAPLRSALPKSRLLVPVLPLRYRLDKGFRGLAMAASVTVFLLLVLIFGVTAWRASPAIAAFHLDFLTQQRWNPVTDTYGVIPQVYGTLVTSLIALLLAVPISVAVAIVLTEDVLPRSLQSVVAFLIEILAAVPSVVFGLWGLFVIIPIMRDVGNWLFQTFSWVPLFSTPSAGPNVLTSGIILAIMIIPIIATISRDVLLAVPRAYREGAVAVGATRWETIWHVLLPGSATGILGASMLGLGRAMGETMAVTMVIGNANRVNVSLLAPGSTIPSLLASQFNEASGLQIGALLYAALVLLVVTLIVNVIAELLVLRIAINTAED